MWARRMQGALEAVAQGPWPAAALSFCPADGGRLAALGAGALALWRLRTLLGAPELTFDLAATPGARAAALTWQKPRAAPRAPRMRTPVPRQARRLRHARRASRPAPRRP